VKKVEFQGIRNGRVDLGEKNFKGGRTKEGTRGVFWKQKLVKNKNGGGGALNKEWTSCRVAPKRGKRCGRKVGDLGGGKEKKKTTTVGDCLEIVRTVQEVGKRKRSQKPSR